MSKTILRFTVLYFLSISPQPYAAGAGGDTALENIIVSGTRFESIHRDNPVPVTVITSRQIEQSGAGDLADVLRASGGVQISDLFGDGSDASVGLRGFSDTAQQNTLILVDGRRLNNADNGLPDLNTVALENIEQVEIVKGSLGVLYGDKAVGGVVNIVTRRPESFGARMKADIGSYGYRSLFAGLENRHDNGISYRFNAIRRLNDNYRDNNAMRLTNLAADVAWSHAGGGIFLEYQHLDENSEVSGPLFTDQLIRDRRQALNPADEISTGTGAGRIGIRQAITAGLDLIAEYTHRLSDTAGQLSSGGVPGFFTSKRHHLEFTPRLAWIHPVAHGDARVTLGVDLFKTDYDIRSDFGITDNTQVQQSLYGRIILPVTPRLTVAAGARRGEVENDILVDTLAFGRSLPEGTVLEDGATAWEGGLSFAVTPAWRVFGKLDRHYRFVTADEYSAVADNNFFARLFSFGTAMPLPRTQTGVSRELGTEWRDGDKTVSLGIYQLDVDNEIVFDPAVFLNTNLGETRRRGIIFDGRYQVSDKLELTAAYSYIDAEMASGELKGKDLTFIADHTGGISAGYRFSDNLTGYLEATAVSRREFGGDFAHEFAGLPGHAVGNLNLSYRQGDLRLSLRVNNLLDRRYSDAGNVAFDFRRPFPSPRVETWYPAPARNFLLSLEYHR